MILSRRQIFLMAVAIFAGHISLSFAGEGLDSALPTPVGRAVWIKGSLHAIMPNKEERILKKASVIYLNDTLITDANSQAQIAFTDNSLMTFRPSTKFYIDQYTFDPKKKSGSVGQYVMSLIEGGFRTITGLIAKSNPPDYRINTPVATIGVRGTDYTVNFQKGQLFMEFNQGSPCVSNSKGALCLTEANKFAKVSSSTTAPSVLNTQPVELSQKLDVVPIKIATFTNTSSGATPTGVTNGPSSTMPASKNSGPISSFCISQ